MKPSGIERSDAARRSSDTSNADAGVSTNDGATALTRMCCGACSSASVCVNCATAAFAAPYAAKCGEPFMPCSEQMFTIAPPSPVAASAPIALWHASSVPVTLSSRTSARSPAASSIVGPAATPARPPTLLTHATGAPRRRRTSAVASSSSALCRTSTPRPIASVGNERATSSARSASMSSTATFAPTAANSSQIPRPRPCPPPVTTATRPAKPNRSVFMRRPSRSCGSAGGTRCRSARSVRAPGPVRDPSGECGCSPR